MKQVSIRALAVVCVLIAWCAAPMATGQQSVRPAGSAGPERSGAQVSFFSDRTTLWVGQTAVVPVRVAGGFSGEIPASIEPAQVGAVLGPARVLAGQTLGFVRVRISGAGSGVLKVGDAMLAFEARKPALEAELFDRQPVLVGPAQFAAVWGKVAVGVQVLVDHASGATGPVAKAQPKVELKLTSGRSLGMAEAVAVESAPLRHFVFLLDADALPPGPAELIAAVTDADGSVRTSEPLTLSIVQPVKKAGGFCHETIDGPRTKRAGNGRVLIVRDPTASSGKAVLNASTEPAWCVEYDAPVAGLYQMMVVARADFGGGAFASLGMMVGEQDQASSSSRLVDGRWHRIPVGLPMSLPAGKSLLSARFINDFAAPDNSDRNLFLDRYEIALIAVSPEAGIASAGGAEGAMMMSSGGAAAGGGSAGGTMMVMSPAAGGDAMAAGGSGAMSKLMAMASGADMMAMGRYPLGDEGTVRVAFARPMHDQPVRGDMKIVGFCAWPAAKVTPEPRVSLLINGKSVMTQRAGEPVFRIGPGHLVAGQNTVQLKAVTDAGVTGLSPVQVLHADAAAIEGAAAREYRRYSPVEREWGATTASKLTDKDRLEGHRHARVGAGESISLTLSPDLAGSQEIWLDGRFESPSGFVTAIVTLKTPEKETKLGEAKLYTWPHDARVGVFEIPKGQKQLVVTWASPSPTESKSEQGNAINVRALSLRDPPDAEDRNPPKVTLLYPTQGQKVYRADALVFDACDNDQLAWVDVVIDGRRQGGMVDAEQGWGRYTLPLLARQLSPGAHRVRLRAEDRSGNQAESEEITIEVLAEAPAELTRYERAVRVLNRFAYGPDSDELAAILVEGDRAYLASRLSRRIDDPGDAAAIGRAAVYMTKADYYHQVSVRVAAHLQMTPNPVRARFVAWTENHFSTWQRKVEGWRKWPEHAAFSRLGAAPFAQLLNTSASSPAMLVYLDQQHSFASKLNENYARELLELHTVGVRAGYSQADVTSLAGVLNGWTVAEEAPASGRGFPIASNFRYDASLNDGQARRVFGQEFPALPPASRVDNVLLALQTLASHPSTAQHVSRELIEHYALFPAPQEMVDDIASEFHRTGGDMSALLLAIAAHPRFAQRDLPARVARPMDYAVRLARCTRSDDHWQLVNFLDRSGMGIFDCVAPNGFGESDASYSDSNAVLQRWRMAKHHEWRLSTMIPNGWRWSVGADAARWRQNVIDALAVRLTGSVLGPESNRAALDVLEGRDPANKESSAPKPGTEDFDRWIQQVSAFVASLPEASMR